MNSMRCIEPLQTAQQKKEGGIAKADSYRYEHKYYTSSINPLSRFMSFSQCESNWGTSELFTSAFDWEPEEVVTSDLVAGGFPTDMGEGGVNPIFPLVAAFEYIYPRRQLTRMQHVYP